MLVGVPSYRSAVALQRRDAIREMGFVGSSAEANARAELLPSCVSPACTWLRFVMAEDQADVDKEHGDVWFFKLPARRRAKKSYGLEKYLLSNAFLREAARRADSPPLVVLADDDTLFNATDLSLRMAPFAASPRLVFGNLEEWFMWDPVAMISTCYAYSSRRWELAQLAARNRSFSELSRREKECVHARAVGPFPYAKGHFLGYSLPTAKLLVSLFGGDEEYSLNGRTTNLIEHPFYNKLLKPTHPQHPTNKVLTEDVYYMHLLFKALRNDSLTLLHLTLSEYVVERGNRALRRADIYHKLKRPERFAFVRSRPQLLTPGPAPAPGAAAAPRCEPMTSKYRVRRGGQLVARLDHCCQEWRWCDLSAAHGWRRRVRPV